MLFRSPLELEFNSGSYIKHDKDEDLLSGKPMSALFWVGPIPISVSVTPTIKYIHNISVKGTAIARWGFYYDMNFRKGVKYARGSGWSPIKEFSQEYGLKPFEAEAQIETSAKVGIYAQMDVAIYGVEAAYVKVGGYIEGNAGVGWKWDIASSSQWEVNVNCNWGLEGYVGSSLKIGSIQLVDWESPPLKLWGPSEIMNKTYLFPYDD